MPKETLESMILSILWYFVNLFPFNQTVCIGFGLVQTKYRFDIEFFSSFIMSFRIERITDKEYSFSQSGTNKQAQLSIQAATYGSDFICCCVSVQRQRVSQFSGIQPRFRSQGRGPGNEVPLTL